MQAYYGLTRAILIPANYLHEGRVRRRKFAPEGYEFNLIAEKKGSFESVFELVTSPDALIVGGVGAGIAANFATDFIKSVINRAVGKKAKKSVEDLEKSGILQSGDTAALTDAVEPALKVAHSIVNNGVMNINLTLGSGAPTKLDQSTKDFVWATDKDDTFVVKLLSTASFNANTWGGRFYDYDEKRTIPFEIMQGIADQRTINIIAESLSKYARRGNNRGEDSAVAVRYTRNIALDGRTKKIFVWKARREIAGI